MGASAEIAHTRNAPLLSLESQRHFPRSVGGISLDYATKYTLLRSVYFATLRGVRRKNCGSAEDVLLRSAEVSNREVRKPIANR